jgi:hypothetical protein
MKGDRIRTSSNMRQSEHVAIDLETVLLVKRTWTMEANSRLPNLSKGSLVQTPMPDGEFLGDQC